MKYLIPVFFFILLAKTSVAQQDLLSFDEHNKYIYYQVENMPGIPADTLEQRGLKFLKTGYPKILVKQDNTGKIGGQGKFLVYGGISVLKHEKGEIAFMVNIEFKDQKYRFWLTGFVFTPYQRDRYDNFVPQQGVDIPLEQGPAKLDKKDFDGYLDETGAFCKQFGERLKTCLSKLPEAKKAENVKKVVTDNW
ncbi:MAG TPA: DUF4468 domain-containing protein [Mucilaginibacter sp.]|jgi:hypothetical protein|nr:DUF4468 domain-containing protein [Mucilaginibacter sp.]